MRRFAVLPLSLVLASAVGGPAGAAEPFTPEQRAAIVQIVRDALRQDPSILRDAVETLRADDLAREHAATRDALAAHRSDLVRPEDQVAGNPSGDVTIVEFFDIKCPYCKRLEPDMAEFLRQDHGVRLVYKDIPILGPTSTLAARAVVAAQRQGRYEALREALMHDGATLDQAEIDAQAGRLGLDVPRLRRDMADPAVQARIDANLRLAQELHITGTPALVVGDALIPGALSVAELREAVAGARAGG